MLLVVTGPADRTVVPAELLRPKDDSAMELLCHLLLIPFGTGGMLLVAPSDKHHMSQIPWGDVS